MHQCGQKVAIICWPKQQAMYLVQCFFSPHFFFYLLILYLCLCLTSAWFLTLPGFLHFTPFYSQERNSKSAGQFKPSYREGSGTSNWFQRFGGRCPHSGMVTVSKECRRSHSVCQWSPRHTHIFGVKTHINIPGPNKDIEYFLLQRRKKQQELTCRSQGCWSTVLHFDIWRVWQHIHWCRWGSAGRCTLKDTSRRSGHQAERCTLHHWHRGWTDSCLHAHIAGLQCKQRRCHHQIFSVCNTRECIIVYDYTHKKSILPPLHLFSINPNYFKCDIFIIMCI